ncbi:MAG: enoyl-CoA hydratase [Pseudomonadota bacterium]|nr:enoyl-CoA hydratase [Pseudomonadota bacterium]
MAEEAEIIYEVRDRIARIVFNRPDKLNAITRSMQVELRQRVAEASTDPAVRVIVLTGAGRGFCAGADMNLLSGISAQGGDAPKAAPPEPPAVSNPFGANLGELYQGRHTYLLQCPKPIIAAINGPAAGLGLVLALYADVRLAAAGARFTTSFSQRGLIAEHGSSWLLPRLVGHANALDLLMTSRKFSAEEALRMGLVNQVYDDADFEAAVTEYARMLADTVSPRSLAVIKAQVYAALVQGFPEAMSIADAAMEASFGRPDFKEGVAHFMEKRPARFADLGKY